MTRDKTTTHYPDQSISQQTLVSEPNHITQPSPNHSSHQQSAGSIESNLISTERLLTNWQTVLSKMQTAIQSQQQSQQSQTAVQLIAVSKTKPASMIRTLAVAGQVDFAENYLQEALEKIQQLKQMDICWHYIGHIQRNKTRDIAQHFNWVHTLEREVIAKRLHDQRPDGLPALNVLIQVNIDNEASKSGCQPDELDDLVKAISGYSNLCLRGLMVIPENIQQQASAQLQPKTAFARTQALFDYIAKQHPQLTHWDTLSMGMSADMEEAIAHGSTMVRVGSAIFGKRDAHK